MIRATRPIKYDAVIFVDQLEDPSKVISHVKKASSIYLIRTKNTDIILNIPIGNVVKTAQKFVTITVPPNISENNEAAIAYTLGNITSKRYTGFLGFECRDVVDKIDNPLAASFIGGLLSKPSEVKIYSDDEEYLVDASELFETVYTKVHTCLSSEI
jgi:hypothetical protein